MILQHIQSSLHATYNDMRYSPETAIVCHIFARLDAISLIAKEAFYLINLTLYLPIRLIGVAIAKSIGLIFPKLNPHLPTWADTLKNFKQLAGIIIGIFSTILFGFLISPQLNFDVHQKLGLINPSTP